MFFAWNVRGLNGDQRHTMTKDWINIHRPLFGVFYETHIREIRTGRIASSLPAGWKFYGNFEHHETARIVVVWDPCVSVIIYQASSQAVTCGVYIPGERLSCTVTFVYGSNILGDRQALWDELGDLNATSPVSRHPWAVVGDFNQILRASQHSNYQVREIDTSGIDAFNLALHDAELYEAQAKGLPFTWWNNQADNPISKKIDHALINLHWASAFPDAYAEFLDPQSSDHSVCLFRLPSCSWHSCKPFKFPHHIIDHPQYADTVREEWSYASIHGSAQYKLTLALKMLKPALKSMNKRHFSGITERVRDQAAEVQRLLKVLLTNPEPTNSH